MQNIVMIPAWTRDDFLQVTLDKILESEGCDKMHYVFCLDRKFSQNVLTVANRFPLSKEIRQSVRHNYHGNSYNMLEGYKYIIEHLVPKLKSELIFMIEEDIWVGRDFFTFHECVQNCFDSFCVSACRCQNDSNVYPHSPESVYYHPTFQSLGLSWRPSNLKKVIAHAKPEYYRNMRGYILNRIGMKSFGEAWTEQDGLIMRLLQDEKYKCIYPYVPRSFHAGFVGYNRRGMLLKGSLEERVEKLKNMTADEMNQHALVYKDITPIDLSNNYKTDKFHLIS